MKTILDEVSLVFEIPLHGIGQEIKTKLLKSIDSHKYFLNEIVNKEISTSEAISSYAEYYFTPFFYFFTKNNLIKLSVFQENAWEQIITLFLNIQDHWHYLKEKIKYPPISIEEATISYYLLFKREALQENSFFTYLYFSIRGFRKKWNLNTF